MDTQRTQTTAAQPQHDRLEWAFLIIALLALLALVASQLLPGESNSGKPARKVSDELEHQKRVNTYLQQMDLNLTAQRQHTQAQNIRTAAPIRDVYLAPEKKVPGFEPGVDLRQSPWAEQTLQDLRRPSRYPNFRKDIDASVNLQLAIDQRQHEYGDQYESEFRRQFLENAARDGYILKFVNDTQVEIVRGPTSGTGSGAQ